MTERQPVADLCPLAPMIGRWASEGETIATDDEPSIVIVGTDVYTWLADGHFKPRRRPGRPSAARGLEVAREDRLPGRSPRR
jgi:hypothetical protein